jgi:hypothetical protein
MPPQDGSSANDYPLISPLQATQIPTYNMYSKLWKQLVNGNESSGFTGVLDFLHHLVF